LIIRDRVWTVSLETERCLGSGASALSELASTSDGFVAPPLDFLVFFNQGIME
jgi:hypothetical protein